MIRRLAFILLLSASAQAAHAADDFAGKYAATNGNYRQRAEIKRTAAGYDVSLVVGTPGCSGLFEGAGAVEDGKLVAHTTDPDYKDDKCRIVISRTPKGIAVTEDGCTTWHGASCDFEGERYRKR